MAISETHYRLLEKLRDDGVLPQGGSILEIGAANWYGDADPAIVSPELTGGHNQFYIVRKVYEKLFAAKSVTSIDLDPAARNAMRHDLNSFACSNGDRGAFDVTINHGTAEHIFNIANVFKVMHDSTAAGGLMIHESPFTGWVDHGFYCLQPTLFLDVAAANGYEIVLITLEHLASKSVILCESRENILELARCDRLPNNAMLFVVMRKGGDEPFRIPVQGIYSGQASDAAKAAWRELR